MMKTLTLLASLILLAACAQPDTTAKTAQRGYRSNHLGISNESGSTELYGSIGVRAKAGK